MQHQTRHRHRHVYDAMIASQAKSSQAPIHLLAATTSSAPPTAWPLLTLHLFPLLRACSRSEQIATSVISHSLTDLLPRQFVTTSLDLQLAFRKFFEVLDCLTEKANLQNKSVRWRCEVVSWDSHILVAPLRLPDSLVLVFRQGSVSSTQCRLRLVKAAHTFEVFVGVTFSSQSQEKVVFRSAIGDATF